MMHRSALAALLFATGCGGFTVFPEKGLFDSGATGFDPSTSEESAPNGSAGSGMGSGEAGSGGGEGSGSGSSGSDGSGSGGSGSGGSDGSGSGGSGSGGSGSGGSDGSGSGDSGSSGSGSSGSGSGGSGSSGSGSGGSGSGGSGSGGSGSGGSGSGGSSSGPTGGAGTYVIEQAIGEYSPYYYPCQYVFDVYFSPSVTHCAGCDFVIDGTFNFDTAASSAGESYCSVTTRTFAATLAHDSDYLGYTSASMYYYAGLWYPLDYTASYSSGVWSMEWGFRDTLYYFWYYTDYRTLDAVMY